MTSPQPVHVTGGTGGITANRDALFELAGQFSRAGGALAADCWLLTRERGQLGGGLLGAEGDAALDLLGLAQAEHLLDSALHGLSGTAEQTRDIARHLTLAVAGYPWGAEVFDRGPFDWLTGALGDLAVLDGTLFETHSPRQAGEAVLTHDPGLLDHAADILDIGDLADVLSRSTDGTGVAVGTGLAAAGSAPRGLTDLMRALGDRDRGQVPGGIDVRVLTGPDGRRSAIVDITGTRNWGYGGKHVADLYTNERALVGKSTAYEQGVLDAMRQSGVQPTDPVMLVGHSQGGLVAVTAARDAVRTRRFNVTHVVTAGSPIGLTAGTLPSTVRVLALENAHDVVPHADGRRNPDTRTVTTVSSSRGDGSISGNHSIDASYVPLADDAERSGNRSVRGFLTSARDFLRAEQATTHTYQVERR